MTIDVVSLDDAAQQHQSISRQLGSAGIPFGFVDAVRGISVPLQAIEQYERNQLAGARCAKEFHTRRAPRRERC